MSHALKIVVNGEVVTSRKIKWNDCNDIKVIEKSLGLDSDTGKTRGLTDKEVEWIEQNVHIWAKPIVFIK